MKLIISKEGNISIYTLKIYFSSPTSGSELDGIEQVRLGTWVTDDKPFLTVNASTTDHRSETNSETLRLKELQDNDAEQSMDFEKKYSKSSSGTSNTSDKRLDE